VTLLYMHTDEYRIGVTVAEPAVHNHMQPTIKINCPAICPTPADTLTARQTTILQHAMDSSAYAAPAGEGWVPGFRITLMHLCKQAIKQPALKCISMLCTHNQAGTELAPGECIHTHTSPYLAVYPPAHLSPWCDLSCVPAASHSLTRPSSR
jgi:hypothetical protein